MGALNTCWPLPPLSPQTIHSQLNEQSALEFSDFMKSELSYLFFQWQRPIKVGFEDTLGMEGVDFFF